MLKNMKLATKLIGGFVLVALIVLVVGFFGWNGAQQLQGHIEEIGEVRLPSIEALLMTDLAIEEIMVAQRTLMTEFLTAEERATQIEHFHEAREELYEQWEFFKTLPATDEEKQISDRIDVDLAEWRQHNDEWLEMMEEFHTEGLLDPGELVETFHEARGDYYAIAGNVAEYIAFDDAFDGGDQASETTLGHWLAEFSTENTTILGLMRQFEAPMTTFHQSVGDIRALVAQGERAAADTVYHDRLLPAELELFDLLYTGIAYAEDADAMRNELTGLVMGPLYDEARDVMNLVDELVHVNEAIADSAVETAGAEGQNVQLIALVGMIVGVILALILGILLTRAITKPIAKGVAFAQEIARGRLDIELDVRQKDEVGVLADALREMLESLQYKAGLAERIAQGDLTVEVELASNDDGLGKSLTTMVDSLNDILGQVRVAVEQVAAGAGQVSSASQDLSQGATESASSLEEITSSINEINSQSRQNTDNAAEASQLSKQAATDAEGGQGQMTELRGAMDKISGASDEIKKVVKVIDDIAFQINLLALNANVEAARAGKYGKGFAVVAEEVRNLAVRAADAVKETTGMVERSVDSIETGNELTGQTAEQLESIVGGAQRVAQFLEEIAAASKEQSLAIEQITDGLGQVDQVTQSNTASAEESASASEELSSQADQLRASVATFKLKKVTDAAVLTAPGASAKAVPAREGGSQPGNGHAAQTHQSGNGNGTSASGQTRSAGTATATRTDGNGHGRPDETIQLDDDEFDRF